MNISRDTIKSSIDAKKKWGQHFLVSEHHRSKLQDSISSLSSLYPESSWFEIGPGSGSLTEMLVETGQSVSAIDIDTAAIDHIRHHFPLIEIIQGDAADVKKYPITDQFIIVGNLPYNIASRIMVDIAIHHPSNPLLFMIQKEVAKKIQYQPFTLFGAWINLWYITKVEFHLPPSAYHPQPRVHSSVLRLVPREDMLEHTSQYRAELLSLTKKLFRFPKKLLRNNLKDLLTEDNIKELYIHNGWDDTVRLNKDNFSQILFALHKKVS